MLTAKGMEAAAALEGTRCGGAPPPLAIEAFDTDRRIAELKPPRPFAPTAVASLAPLMLC